MSEPEPAWKSKPPAEHWKYEIKQDAALQLELNAMRFFRKVVNGTFVKILTDKKTPANVKLGLKTAAVAFTALDNKDLINALLTDRTPASQTSDVAVKVSDPMQPVRTVLKVAARKVLEDPRILETYKPIIQKIAANVDTLDINKLLSKSSLKKQFDRLFTDKAAVLPTNGNAEHNETAAIGI